MSPSAMSLPASPDGHLVKTWVVGHDGLLGSALTREATGPLFSSSPVPWGDDAATLATLKGDFDRFIRWCDGQPWAIMWAAGTAVPSSPAALIEAQEAVLIDFAQYVAGLGARQSARLAGTPSGDCGEPVTGPGVFWYPSTVTVYGSSHTNTWSEADPTSPRGPYPASKLRQEQTLTQVFTEAAQSETVQAETTHHGPVHGARPVGSSGGDAAGLARQGIRLVIGRINTLYGPGQDISKPQGLITKMCYEAITHGVVTIMVPMESLRDYVYVDDAALLAHATVRTALASQDTVTLRILGSGRATSIAELVRIIHTVVGRRTHLLVVPASPDSVLAPMLVAQTQDRSLHTIPHTSLIDGIHRVTQDIRQRLARSG